MKNHSEGYEKNYFQQIIFDKRKKKILQNNQNKKKIILSPEDFIKEINTIKNIKKEEFIHS